MMKVKYQLGSKVIIITNNNKFRRINLFSPNQFENVRHNDVDSKTGTKLN